VLYKILLGISKRIISHRTPKYMIGCHIRKEWEMWTGIASLGQEPACEYGNELLGSIKSLEFKVELSNLQLFKSDCAVSTIISYNIWKHEYWEMKE